MGRRFRILLALAALALLVPACQMEMGIGTKLNRDGSGTFSMALAVDKEFVDGLNQADRETAAAGGEVTGIEGFDNFFDSLKDKGWRVKTEKTAAGDVAYSGRCDFPNASGFDACLKQLSGAEGGDDAFSFKDSGLRFDFRTERGFFKTKSIFAGTVNLAAPGTNEMTQAVTAIASRVFRFEVRADLPGTERIVKGAGVVRDGVAVWRPQIGEKIDFRAESSAYNPAAIVAVALPLLLLFGLLVWRLARRKPAAAGPEGFVPAGFQDAEPADVIDRGPAS